MKALPRVRTRFLIPAAMGWLLVWLPMSLRADSYRILLHDATPADAARALSRVLPAPVEIAGGGGRMVTLDATFSSPSAALDAVASALDGSWRAVLRVRPGKAGPSGSLADPGRPVPLSLRDIPARKAFQLVAQALHLEADLAGDLSQRVTVDGHAGAEILDGIAKQAGATWSLTYRIQAPDYPVAIPLPRVRLVDPVPVPPPPAPPEAAHDPVPAVPGPARLRVILRDAVNRLVRTGPALRAEAVRQFVREQEPLLRALDQLPPGERARSVRILLPILSQWHRLYRGLAPAVQEELAPVNTLLERFESSPLSFGDVPRPGTSQESTRGVRSRSARMRGKGVDEMGQMPENRLEAYMPIDDLVGQRSLPFDDIRGYEVRATSGRKVGHVKDIYVDPNTLEPCFALLRYEKFLNFHTKRLLVGWQELTIGEGFVQTRRVDDELHQEAAADSPGETATDGPEEAVLIAVIETDEVGPYTPAIPRLDYDLRDSLGTEEEEEEEPVLGVPAG